MYYVITYASFNMYLNFISVQFMDCNLQVVNAMILLKSFRPINQEDPINAEIVKLRYRVATLELELAALKASM